MELPHLGSNCSENTCNKLDFLPMKCDVCQKIFCNDHFKYENHDCPLSYKKNVQVPVCPLCNTPIPGIRGQPPDIAVGAHIDSDCQSDPAKTRRKVFTNRCSMKGCKTKEIVPVLCGECSLNFCLKHRHFTDHKCEGKAASLRRNIKNAALSRVPQRNGILAVQGSMDEDEALARALALSMQDQNGPRKVRSQEEMDAELARQLQQQEHQQPVPARGRNLSSSVRDRCRVS